MRNSDCVGDSSGRASFREHSVWVELEMDVRSLGSRVNHSVGRGGAKGSSLLGVPVVLPLWVPF